MPGQALALVVVYVSVGLIAGLLDYGFAAGFGLVASLALVGLLGMDPRTVAGAAALAQVATAAPALYAHRSLGNTGDAGDRQRARRIVSGLAASSLLGALLASLFYARVAGWLASLLYPAGLLGLALLLATSQESRGKSGGGDPGDPGGVGIALLYGFAAGVYKALVGGGYSAFIVLAKRRLGLGTRAAIALTPVTKLPSFLAVAIIYALSGHMDWLLAALLSLGALASAPLAARILHRVGPEKVRLVLVAVLVAVALYRLVSIYAWQR